MTNAELLVKIKAEIERRKKSLRAGICNEEVFTRKQRKEMLVASEELGRFKRFLSTLESEKPMNQEGLEEEIKRYGEKNMFNIPAFQQVARHFAQWGAEHFRDSTKMMETPNDLKEAAEEYRQGEVDTGCDYIDDSDGDSLYHSACLADAFVAGAKWQAEQDQETIELAEDHAYLAGADWQKEQMLKEAVEGEIIATAIGHLRIVAEANEKSGVKDGDKVRIIVCKKED